MKADSRAVTTGYIVGSAHTKNWGERKLSAFSLTWTVVLCAAVIAVPAAQAQTQTEQANVATPQSSRLIVVSLEDRKLALVEDGKVLKTYAVAVGKSSTPSPTRPYW